MVGHVSALKFDLVDIKQIASYFLSQMHLFGNKKFREQRRGMFFHRGKGKVGGAAVNRVHKRKVGVGSAVFTQ